jgi:hypothetical protein
MCKNHSINKERINTKGLQLGIFSSTIIHNHPHNFTTDNVTSIAIG